MDEVKAAQMPKAGMANTRTLKKAKPGETKKKSTTTQKANPAQVAAAQAVKANIGATQTLPQFLATAGQLTLTEREQIIDQALVMLENIFVHLPLKRAMHAINPVQQLKLLKQRHSKLSERAFHDEMISIYTHLRDLHTNYILPDPFNSRTAFMPFRIEEFTQNNERLYAVTQVAPTVTDPDFKPGVIITHWNNIPIDRAVELNAEREAGSNLDARHARGLAAMTIRWMGMSLPPDEEQVIVRYKVRNKTHEIRFDWQVLMPDSPATGVDLLSATEPLAQFLGVDIKAEVHRRVLKLLFAPEAIKAERQMAALGTQAVIEGASPAGEVNIAEVSTMPDVFSSFRVVDTPHGRFGYIRIRTFNVNNDEAFIQEFIRLAGLLPQNGLILDVRGNGGGLITAGERLLQILTPRPIEPVRLHFINTPLTLKLCSQNDFISQWKDSIAQSIETGSIFSQGFPLMPIEHYNDIGQRYQGPVVLITDALCYSTTDIFVAGFQDHKIGKILGTNGNTGAGGANVWTHSLLQMFLPGSDSPFKPIPKGASFRVAVRQTTRVGERAGVPIEDLGIVPDELHSMTKNDILNGNVDLINHAAALLADMPVYGLSAVMTKVAEATIQVTATTKNISRVDVFLNQHPQLSLDVIDGAHTFNLPSTTPSANVLELRGYKDNQPVASIRVKF